MKKILFILLFFPLITFAQKPLPRREKDTLYTSSGFNIYVGQTLKFGTGSGNNGKFKYVNIKNEVTYASLTNNSVVVKQLKNFGISSLGNAYIEIIGTIIFKDGSKGYIDIHMAFDNAIKYSTELIVPDEFRNVQKGTTADEIIKLNKLYRDSIITKEEFETQKQKLLNQ